MKWTLWGKLAIPNTIAATREVCGHKPNGQRPTTFGSAGRKKCPALFPTCFLVFLKQVVAKWTPVASTHCFSHISQGLGLGVALAAFCAVGCLGGCSDSQTPETQPSHDLVQETTHDISPISFPDSQTDTGPTEATTDLQAAPDGGSPTNDAGADAQPTDITGIPDSMIDGDTGTPVQDSDSPSDVVQDASEPTADVSVTPLSLHPQITEFLAKNDSVLADWEGDFSDWIELMNPHSEPISLAGYQLTDDLDDPNPWTFPDITMEPGAFLIVFASDKVPPPEISELHANFKLSGDGDGLALIAPDGTVVQYLKDFPVQLDDLSFGHPTVISSTPLVQDGTSGDYWVPSTSVVPKDWIGLSFDTPYPPWKKGVLPLGMSNQAPSIPPIVLADAQADFSGVQGEHGWNYGYWDGGMDADGIYQPSEFILFPANDSEFGPTNYWTGSKWDWPNGNPPWTEINQAGGHPNGTTTGAWHWVIRRWVSTATGDYYISGIASNPSENGDGTICRILQNGKEISSVHVDGTTTPYNIPIELLIGDIIDFVIDPGPQKNDYSDGTSFTAQIHHPGSVPEVPPTSALGTPVADSVADWSTTGTQGENSWWYGYYDRGQDPDTSYQSIDFVAFPNEGGGWGPNSFWTGSEWDWFQGNPPWTYIGKTGTHPNSFNNKGGEQWTIRRYVAELHGDLVVEWTLAKGNPNGSGVTGHVFHNGEERDTATIPGAATGGITRTVVLTNVQKGDFVDIAHDPLGVGGDPYDGWDGSSMTVRMWSLPNLSEIAATDLSQDLADGSTAVFVRLPFVVSDPSVFNHLMLQIQYDDGFAAYLNGHLVAQNNVPDELNGQSVALSNHPFGDILLSQPIDLDNALGFLNPGDNVLAIAILNAADDPETLYLGTQLEGRASALNPSTTTYLAKPTPGAENAPAVTTWGPVVQNLTRDVLFQAAEPVLVTAKVIPISGPVQTVTLYYRTMFDGESALPMTDDGQGGDAVANDGVYSSTIPANTALSGQLVRWYVTTTDTLGNTNREPAFLDPTDSEQYVGGLAASPEIVSKLPVFHWFVQNPAAANTDAGTRGGLWFAGEYYDNILFDLHGQSTKGFPKKSYNIDFNSTHRFRLTPALKRMKDINWLTNYADKSKVRNTLSYETFAAIGSASHLAFPIRVEMNGQFFGLYDFVEDADNIWLERLGLDPDGALYKMYDTLSNVSAGEKKTRKQEDKTDLQTLINGMKLPEQQRVLFIYDNVNLAAMAAYLTGLVLTSNADCCHKNYYAYRDTNGSGEWQYMPWDLDLTWGRNWTGGYFDDTMYSQNGIWVGANNALIAALYDIPAFREMFLRRLRTVMDAVLQAPTTPAELRLIENRLAELLDVAGPDATTDFGVWPTWGQTQTMAQGIDQLVSLHLGPRRQYLFDTLSAKNGEIPPAQTAISVLIDTVLATPNSGNPDEQYVALTNPESTAVDISSWTLGGDVSATFPPGTVIPKGQTLYVSPDAQAFRARPESPTGGEGRFVQGVLKGVLPPIGTVELKDQNGVLIDALTY